MLKSLNNYFNHTAYRVAFLLLIALIITVCYAASIHRDNRKFNDMVKWANEGCWSYNTQCKDPLGQYEECIKKTDSKTPFYIRDKVYVPYAMCPKPIQVLPPK